MPVSIIMSHYLKKQYLLVVALLTLLMPLPSLSAPAAPLSFPSPEINVGASSNFSWPLQTGASGYWLSIKDDNGHQYGEQRVYSSTTHSVHIHGLPDGEPLDVQLYTIYPAGNETNWDSRSTYRLNAPASSIQYPYESSLSGAKQWVVWDQVKGASYYYLKISDNNGHVYFQQNMQQSDRVEVLDLPTDGRDITIRLYTVVGSNWDRVSSKTFTSVSTVAVSTGSLVSGFDWSVPAEPSSSGGMVDEQWSRVSGPASDEARPSYVNTVAYELKWRDVYAGLSGHGNAFQAFEYFLNHYADNRQVLVRLDTTSRCDLPPALDAAFNYYGGTSIAFWENNYLTELNRLVSRFGSRYANDPRVVGVHVGIADGEYISSADHSRIYNCNDVQSDSDRWGWGELNMEEEELASAIDVGFTPAKFNSGVRGIIDSYANAFQGNESKLVFMNYNGFVYDAFDQVAVASDYITEFNNTLIELGQYAKSRGLGNRDGLVENWMGYTAPEYGMTFTPVDDARNSCNLGMDEYFADSIQGRYWGTENEEYGYQSWISGRFGGYSEQPYRFMVSSLRALQMRRNYMTISSNGMNDILPSEYNTAGMLDYLSRTLGRSRTDTPDAFVVHGERYVRQDKLEGYNVSACVADNHARVREFGRWLTEVEAGGWPSMRKDLSNNNYLFSQSYGLPEINGSKRYEYLARWYKRFTFDIDDVVVANRCHATCNAEVKVVFNDVTATTLVVENQQGVLSKVLTSGTGGIKTATFPVNTTFNNTHLGADFTVRTENNADSFPIMLTRINFLNY